MARSFDVTLHKDRVPIFPERCVVCSKRSTTFAGISHDNSSTSLGYWFPLSQLFGEGHADVPLCRSCVWKFWTQRWMREWGYIVFAVAGIFVLAGWLADADWSEAARAWLIGGLGLGFVLSWIILSDMFPRHFESSIYGDTVRYEFSNRRFAMEFAALNGTRAQVH